MIAVLAAAATIAGCGDSKKTEPATASAPEPAAAGTDVDVTEADFSISGVDANLKAGTYTFNVKNTGNAPHNLTIDGPGVADQASATANGGGTGSVTVTLAPGSYAFYCSVGQHRANGMEVQVTVT